MGLTYNRMIIRYRARVIKGVKLNCKRSWKNNLNCRFSDNMNIEDQDHLEGCAGLSWKRRRLKMDTEGRLGESWKVDSDVPRLEMYQATVCNL